jgi:hypothetical protein
MVLSKYRTAPGIAEEKALKLQSSDYPLKLIRKMKLNKSHHPLFWQCLVEHRIAKSPEFITLGLLFFFEY